MARLLVLWLLSERASTGYEIKRALDDTATKFWFGLEDGSIYSVLKTLAKHGHVSVSATERAGNRPTRTRYRITASGRNEYRRLLDVALRDVVLARTPFDVAIAARGDLDPTVVSEALSDRSKRLRELAEEIAGRRAGAPSPALADRHHAIVCAEADWLDSLDHRSVT